MNVDGTTLLLIGGDFCDEAEEESEEGMMIDDVPDWLRETMFLQSYHT
jgi:hypothetical protein